MRLIFTILLIGLFKADAQIVINASQPYRVLQQDLLLDIYPSQSGYSLRKLDKNYTGAAIRVRKDTTGQPEQDIFFTTAGDLDTVSLKNFIGLNNGFVTTWYSQADSNGVFNVRNATQTISANQPRIINAGVVERLNGKVTLFFDGTNDHLRCFDNAPLVNGEDKPYSVVSVLSKTNINTAGCIFCFGRNTGASPDITLLLFQMLSTGNDYSFQIRDESNVNNQFSGGNYSATTQYLASFYTTGLSFEIFQNNSSQLTNTYNRGNVNTVTATIGALVRSSTTIFFGGNIQEVIFYNSDKKSDRSLIETNINTYYGIY